MVFAGIALESISQKVAAAAAIGVLTTAGLVWANDKTQDMQLVEASKERVEIKLKAAALAVEVRNIREGAIRTEGHISSIDDKLDAMIIALDKLAGQR